MPECPKVRTIFLPPCSVNKMGNNDRAMSFKGKKKVQGVLGLWQSWPMTFRGYNTAPINDWIILVSTFDVHFVNMNFMRELICWAFTPFDLCSFFNDFWPFLCLPRVRQTLVMAVLQRKGKPSQWKWNKTLWSNWKKEERWQTLVVCWAFFVSFSFYYFIFMAEKCFSYKYLLYHCFSTGDLRVGADSFF